MNYGYFRVKYEPPTAECAYWRVWLYQDGPWHGTLMGYGVGGSFMLALREAEARSNGRRKERSYPGVDYDPQTMLDTGW